MMEARAAKAIGRGLVADEGLCLIPGGVTRHFRLHLHLRLRLRLHPNAHNTKHPILLIPLEFAGQGRSKIIMMQSHVVQKDTN